MLIRLFKTNYFLQLVFIFLLPTLLWIPLFTNPNPSIFHLENAAPLYGVLYKILLPFPYFSIVIAYILILLQAFYVSYIFAKHNLIPKTTLLPTFLYAMIMSGTHYLLPALHPGIIINLFLILSFSAILDYPHSNDVLGKIFMSGFWISIASLFYFPAITYLALIFIAFLVFKIYHWREWMVSLLGILAPFIFMSTYLFLTDTLFYELEIFQNSLLSFAELNFTISLKDIVFFIIFGFLSLISIFSIYKSIYEHIIFFRKKCFLMLYYLVLAVPPFLCLASFQFGVSLFALPFSFLFCIFLLGKQKKYFHDTLLFIFILLIFLNTYIAF